jgi:iron complex outermembrane receptor protein
MLLRTFAAMLTLAFIAVAGALVSVPALAREQAQASSEMTLQTVVVTGSMIKRTDKETPSPVQVISDEDLKSTG